MIHSPILNWHFSCQFFSYLDTTGENFFRSQKKPAAKREKLVSSRELHKYQTQNQEIQEENNTLKCKNEILIDMIAEVYSEFKLQKDLKNSPKKTK